MLEDTKTAVFAETMETEHGINVLLVDDKKEDLLALEVLLKTENYNFVKATSGRGALRILLKKPDFAIILMDVNMPLMDGLETAELIRESDRLKHIPIIFLTASNDSPDTIFRGYETGAVDYMIKPVIPEILRAKINVFADLYKKTKELEKQKKNLLKLNHELEKRTKEISRSNNELEKFAYVASHDMQEPLRTIISYIGLIREKFDSSVTGEVEKYMDYVVNAGYRMRDVITGLLEYSRIDNLKQPFAPVNCTDIVKEVMENLRTSIETNKVRIDFADLPTITANYMQMVLLFQNLLSNAIKFKNDRNPYIKIAYKKTDSYHLFSISDNGIGIEQKYADGIFQIFRRLHPVGQYSGVGIGLSICKKIVERHNGKIWVESVSGQGSTFYFTISDT